MKKSAATDVIVVGGGVIGLFCAYHLLRAGRSVRIVDQGELGRGSSWANCGLITPSHAPPLALPGAIGKALQSMIDPTSPFYVRPTLSPALIGWFLRFAARCNRQDMLESLKARAAILQSSRDLFDSILARHAMQCEWETLGLLMVYRSEQNFHEHDSLDRVLNGFGLPADRLNGREAQQREPALVDGLYGARFYAMDAHLRPDRLVSELIRIVRELGAEIDENLPMEGLRLDGDRAVGIQTQRGGLEARDVVLATGAWSGPIGAALKLKVPILPGKGYTVTMKRPAICPRIPLLLKERSIAVTPWESGYRLGGTMEFAGYDTSINGRRVAAILDGAAEYLHTPTGEPESNPWYGWRPMTYDGVPLLGPAPGYEGLHLAAGHNMLGVSMGPGSGRLVAELITGADPHIDPAPYSPARFAG